MVDLWAPFTGALFGFLFVTMAALRFHVTAPDGAGPFWPCARGVSCVLHNRKIWIDEVGLMPSTKGARNPPCFHCNATHTTRSAPEHTTGRFRAP